MRTLSKKGALKKKIKNVAEEQSFMLNEIKMHAMLSQHTDLIPRYFQSWVEEGSIFLVTELMQGNLSTMNKSKILREEELLKVI